MPDRIVQTAFNGGEFGPLARDRADLDAYFQGAEILENLFPLVEGAIRRRPGFELVAEVKNHADRVRLLDFVKSNEDAVLIEAGPIYFRYYGGGGMARIMDGITIVETATPYDAATLETLYWSQSADVLFITTTLATIAPRALRRFSDINWSLIEYPTKFGPFLARNDAGGTLNPSGVTGSISIVASGPLFAAGHVGARFRFWQPGLGIPYQKWLPEKAVTLNDLWEFAGNVYLALNTGTTSNQPPVHESGTVADRASGAGVISWTYQHDLSGSAVITSVVDAVTANATVEERLPTDLATANWAEGAFSGVQGFPRLVGVYEQRLFFASTLSQPDTLFLSRTEGYNANEADFKPSKGNDQVDDDHAIVRTLADNEVNTPAWAIADEQLILGTARGLIRIAGPSLDEAITPNGASARRIPGSKPAGRGVLPVTADDAILYVSIGARRLYEYLPGNPVRTLNIRASHVGASPIRQMTWCGEPWSRLFALDAAGALWCLVYERTEGVIAWSRVIVGGAFEGGPPIVESVRRVKDDTGLDRLCIAVKRTIGGATRRTIERLGVDYMADRMLADQAVMMDAAVKFDFWNAGAATVTVTAAGGAGAGDAATIAASSGTPFAGRAGQEFRVRKISAPARKDDATGVLRLTIVTVTGGGTGATATLLDDPDEEERLLNAPLTQWGFPSATLTGLALFNGETLAVQADGMDFGLFAVSAGAMTLDEPVMRAAVGFAAPFRGRSLPLFRQIEGGTSRGRKLAIERATASFYETGDQAAKVGVIEDGEVRTMDPAGGRTDQDFMTAAAPLRSFVQSLDLANFGGTEVQVEVSGDGVLPVTLRSIAVEYSHET